MRFHAFLFIRFLVDAGNYGVHKILKFDVKIGVLQTSAGAKGKVVPYRKWLRNPDEIHSYLHNL